MTQPIEPIRNPQSAIRNSPVRQKRTIIVLAVLLIVGGLVVLFLLRRLPLPMRILMGLIDIFAGLGLLVLVRQKFK
jgi:hypothetical protein